MLHIYELPKRIACSYAFSDAYSFIVGAPGMTSCEQNAWEDDTKHTVHFIRVRTRALPWRNDIHPFCGYAHALNLNLYVRAGI